MIFYGCFEEEIKFLAYLVEKVVFSICFEEKTESSGLLDFLDI